MSWTKKSKKQAKTKRPIFLLLFGSLLFSLNLSADTGSADANLNFRASPNGRDIGGVKRGEHFTVLDSKRGWVKIKKEDGRIGWVWKKYVSIQETVKNPTGQAAQTETVQVGELKNISGRLNVRALPSSRSKRVGALENSDEFEIIGQARNGWYKVKTANGTIGYASDNYIQTKVIAAEEQAQPASPTEGPISPQVQVETPRRRPVVKRKPRPAQMGELVNIQNQLNVREGPGTDSARVGTLNPDSEFKIIGQAPNGWYHVESLDGSVKGYASDKYIQKIETRKTAAQEDSLTLASAAEEEKPAQVAAALDRVPLNDQLHLASASAEDTEIEAQCDNCLVDEANLLGSQRDLVQIPDEVLQFHSDEQNLTPKLTQSEKEKCYGQVILKAAKKHVETRYANRSYSGGRCAFGVRNSLQKAGVNRVGALGHAIEYYKRSTRTSGTLGQLGFVNEISKYKTAAKAPPGSVLVFKGPKTAEYLANPGRHNARGKTTGRYVGHVTIKGDDDYYYTDGRTVNPAVAERTLVGIFVMKECKSCKQDVINKCGR